MKHASTKTEPGIIVKASDTLDRFAKLLSGLAIVILVGAVMLQVVARYIFSQPPAYTEELARYAMIWAGLIGATMSFKRRFDPALFNGINKGPNWLRAGARIIKSLVVLIYLLPIMWYVFFGPGMNPARGFLLRHSRTMADALPFSTVWVAIAVPLMIIIILIHLFARWCGEERPGQSENETT